MPESNVSPLLEAIDAEVSAISKELLGKIEATETTSMTGSDIAYYRGKLDALKSLRTRLLAG